MFEIRQCSRPSLRYSLKEMIMVSRVLTIKCFKVLVSRQREDLGVFWPHVSSLNEFYSNLQIKQVRQTKL